MMDILAHNSPAEYFMKTFCHTEHTETVSGYSEHKLSYFECFSVVSGRLTGTSRDTSVLSCPSVRVYL